MRARAQVLSSFAIMQQQRCSIMERALVHEGEVVTLSHRQATWLRSFLSGYQYQESSIIIIIVATSSSIILLQQIKMNMRYIDNTYCEKKEHF